MGKTNPKKGRTDRYAKKTLATRNFVQHALWQHHRLLEQLINNPYASDHLDRIADGEPLLRDALRKAGVAGLTREQLWAKRDDTVISMEMMMEKPVNRYVNQSNWLTIFAI